MHTFPDQIEVEYYDAALPEVQSQFSAFIEEAQSRYWPFPLVIVGDNVAMAGDVNVYHLSRLVKQALETA